MKSCNKRSYLTENIAVDALLEARMRFDQNTSIAVYQCEICNNWHLTSKGTMNQKLADALKNGTMAKSKEAFYWENKLKR